MPFPGVTFGQFLDPANREEHEQYAALVQGFLSEEHNDDGSHSDITATSITVDGDVTAGGDGTFEGDVVAREGDATNQTLIGQISESTVDDGGAGPGIEGGSGSDRFAIYYESAGANDYIKFTHQDKTPLMIRKNGSDFFVGPGPTTNTTCGTYLGSNLSAQHVWDGAYIGEIFASSGATVAQGKWEAFTPSWTNVTVGNGTVVARYTRVMGKTIKGYIHFTLGSTSSISGSVIASVPLTIHASMVASAVRVGNAAYRDATGPAHYWGGTIPASNTTIAAFDNASPFANVNTTVPFTWAQDDVLFIDFEFEEA